MEADNINENKILKHFLEVLTYFDNKTLVNNSDNENFIKVIYKVPITTDKISPDSLKIDIQTHFDDRLNYKIILNRLLKSFSFPSYSVKLDDILPILVKNLIFLCDNLPSYYFENFYFSKNIFYDIYSKPPQSYNEKDRDPVYYINIMTHIGELIDKYTLGKSEFFYFDKDTCRFEDNIYFYLFVFWNFYLMVKKFKFVTTMRNTTLKLNLKHDKNLQFLDFINLSMAVLCLEENLFSYIDLNISDPEILHEFLFADFFKILKEKNSRYLLA
jgi:hypothetical protein